MCFVLWQCVVCDVAQLLESALLWMRLFGGSTIVKPMDYVLWHSPKWYMVVTLESLRREPSEATGCGGTFFVVS